MLEGLINNNTTLCPNAFNLNSLQIYTMTQKDDVNLSKHVTQYKSDYNLDTIDVYVNMALIHGQI